uniref:Uncharacterized protein n=1 Tax=Meloidogyne enterolobii TaxID=390850 RepID=A0A6V7UK93_MELEN|nr:unnamed protein product [Meloidogyne enterolobii]
MVESTSNMLINLGKKVKKGGKKVVKGVVETAQLITKNKDFYTHFVAFNSLTGLGSIIQTFSHYL